MVPSHLTKSNYSTLTFLYLIRVAAQTRETKGPCLPKEKAVWDVKLVDARRMGHSCLRTSLLSVFANLATRPQQVTSCSKYSWEILRKRHCSSFPQSWTEGAGRVPGCRFGFYPETSGSPTQPARRRWVILGISSRVPTAGAFRWDLVTSVLRWSSPWGSRCGGKNIRQSVSAWVAFRLGH